MTFEAFLNLLKGELERRAGFKITDEMMDGLLTSEGKYDKDEVIVSITSILDRPDGASRASALSRMLSDEVTFTSAEDLQKSIARSQAISPTSFNYASGVTARDRVKTGDNDWSEIIGESATIPVRSELPTTESESISVTENRGGVTNTTTETETAIDAPRELLATLTDTLGNAIPLWIQMPNDEDGNQQWVPASKPTSTPLKVRKVDGVWTTVSIPESMTPLSEQWSGKTMTTNGAIYGIMQDGSRGAWLGNETPTPEQFSWGTISQGGKDYFIDKSSSDPWASRIEIGDTKDDDFRAQLQIVGTEAGYLKADNTWNKLFDIPQADMTKFQAATLKANKAATELPYGQMTKAQQATADQARRNADATRARDLMTAQQYDYQNQLGAAQEQRQRFQAAQQAKQATAQLGLQAAQQTQQDFLTFNEILNNPQSALSSMNWMRGAVAPTEENRFGEDPPMNRLADFNKSRQDYNSYLSQMYSQPMPEMPAFNPAASTEAGFMGSSIQNFIDQTQAANKAKIAEQDAIIATQNKTIAAGFTGPTNTSNIPATNNNAAANNNDTLPPPDSGPYVAPVFSNNPEDNPSFTPSGPDNRLAFLQRQAANRNLSFNPRPKNLETFGNQAGVQSTTSAAALALEKERLRLAAEAQAKAGMAGIGFRR